MRPLRLDLAGFAAFRDETTVDFTDADFFALVGPTGSGKSTLLDAICFALYGTVPRWRDPRSVAQALAPSVNEARVRLVFESAGTRYVASRVVRRDGKGRVKTSLAGLQRMPAGFDIRKLDTGMDPDDLGEPLAGTPSELDEAVKTAVGLPYDQFVTCVLLPQGEFAEFLHAKPAKRQQILVNLLGLSVYEKVRERAVARATRADGELAAVDRVLAGIAEVDESMLAQARQRLTAAEQLVSEVTRMLPALAAAQATRDRSAATLAEHQRQIAQLAAVTPPAEAASLATEAAAARQAGQAAAEAVTRAEDREEKLRGELAAAGDPPLLRELRAAYQERAGLAEQQAALDAAVTTADRAHRQAIDRLAHATDQATQAEAALAQAREAYARAQAADRAMAVRAELTAGEPCPVCEQPVANLPAVPADAAVARAEAAGQQARAAADAAREQLAEHDRICRDVDRTLTSARTRAEALASRVEQLDQRLAGAPPTEQIAQQLAMIAELEQQLAEAGGQVRTAREASRRAQHEAELASQRLQGGWRQFDQVRDDLAGLRPPPTDRDDLAAAWATLAGWAGDTAAALTLAQAEAEAAVRAAEQALADRQAELAGWFAAIGLPVPEQDPAAAASVAAERARAELDRLVGLRQQAERLREQRTGHERDARLARALAQHLRANNFEAWLLAEALDRLVVGASAILRELSAGQYELSHDGREFFVIDHHDAGLRRPVRTLSGGETFQASLALALALAEQLTSMSTTSASLDSILLDEGFGSLDAATLDSVAATLENLAAAGERMVGVVTHVPALAERIPVRFEISKDARSAKVTRVGF